MRESIICIAPRDWIDRYQTKYGELCPVCARLRKEFEKGRRIYCSEKCADDFSKTFVRWNDIRDEVLKRDHYTCQDCGKADETGDGMDVDHIIAVALGGPMWDKDNMETLCEKCHRKKTKEDMAMLKVRRKKIKTLRAFITKSP